MARAVHAACEAIVTVDEQQRIVMINPAAQRMFGCSAAEALGSPLSRFIPADAREAHAGTWPSSPSPAGPKRAWASAASSPGCAPTARAFRPRHRSRASTSPAPAGPSHYFIALLRDLSQEQGLQQQIDALNRRMRAVFELAPVAIWITDSDRIVFANRACAALFGAPMREALIGRSIYELLAPRILRSGAPDGGAGAAGEAQRADHPRTHRPARRPAARSGHRHRQPARPRPHRGADGHHRHHASAQRESRELERSRRELRRLSASMVQAREDERRRIARELHDELGQRLTALKMELSSLGGEARRLRRAPGASARMLEMVDDTVATVRRIATELRPLMLDDLGLNAAIEWLADSWRGAWASR